MASSSAAMWLIRSLMPKEIVSRLNFSTIYDGFLFIFLFFPHANTPEWMFHDRNNAPASTVLAAKRIISFFCCQWAYVDSEMVSAPTIILFYGL